ncbi:hypothetical protein [Haliangium sp.]|uniref:hypothetical protein n=1 Tax=Haliangium sp. TaxID=2663208 RepID=UPI003D10587C
MSFPQPPCPPSAPRRRAWARLAEPAHLAVVAAALAVTGCGEVTLPTQADAGSQAPDASAPVDDPVTALVTNSFEVTAELTYQSGNPDLPIEYFPTQHAFVLRIDESADTTVTDAIAGALGTTAIASFDRLDDGHRVLRSAFELDVIDGEVFDVSLDYCDVGRIEYRDMDLTIHDDDGDGRVDRVRGTAAGRYVLTDGAFSAYLDFSAELDGRLDRTPPRLVLANPDGPVPTSGLVRYWASEPLPRALEPRLVSAGGGALPAPTVLPLFGDAIAGVELLQGEPLPFGVTAQLGFAPELTDLAGNRGLSPAPITTVADPGLFALDGFEQDPVNVSLSGPAAVVAEIGTIGPISGTRSLHMYPGSTALLRIPLGPDTDRAAPLQITMRGLYAYYPFTAARLGQVFVATPGGLTVSARSLPAAPDLIEGNDNDWPVVSPDVTVPVSLPPDAGDEVIVAITASGYSGCEFGSVRPVVGLDASVSLLIDDIEVPTVPQGVATPSAHGARGEGTPASTSSSTAPASGSDRSSRVRRSSSSLMSVGKGM